LGAALTEDTPLETRRSLPVWVIAVAFIILVGFLVLIALGLGRVQSGPIVIGQQVPGFELTTFDNQLLRTSAMKDKVIVLNFWASWCKPCEQEASELEQASQYYNKDGRVAFLGVDYVDTEPEALGYLKKFSITYPNGPDLRTSISQMFRIRGVPETYIIDRSGKLAFIKIGPFSSVDEIKAAIDPLLE
jgi:cytochrome c biogenesis protein CcmG/thiol:disulfide interchange protein DsbE